MREERKTRPVKKDYVSGVSVTAELKTVPYSVPLVRNIVFERLAGTVVSDSEPDAPITVVEEPKKKDQP